MVDVNVLSFFGGMAEQYNKNVAAEQERNERIQEQIRAAQLKYKAKLIEQHSKRMDIVKQVRAHQKAGNYDLATAGIMKADADYTDYEALSKEKNIFTGERNKAAVDYWLSQAENSRTPTWDDDVDQIAKYSNSRQNTAEELYEKMYGVPRGSAIISASHGDGEPLPAAFQFEEKTDDIKPRLDVYDKVDPVTGETYRASRVLNPRTGAPLSEERIYGGKSPTKPARSLDKQERSAINTYYSSALKQLKRDDPQTYDFVAKGIGDGTETGPLHSEFLDRIAAYRMFPNTQAGDAAQRALTDILDMKKYGLVKYNKGSWMTDPSFRILSEKEILSRVEDGLNDGTLTDAEASDIWNRFLE